MPTVKVTKQHYDARDELYTEWYYCQNCLDENSGALSWIASAFEYCPMCGSKIEWDVKREAYD